MGCFKLKNKWRSWLQYALPTIRVWPDKVLNNGNFEHLSKINKTVITKIYFTPPNLLENWNWQRDAGDLRGRDFDSGPPLWTETDEITMVHQNFVDFGLQLAPDLDAVITGLTALKREQQHDVVVKSNQFAT